MDHKAQCEDFISEWHAGVENFTLPTSGSTGAPRPIVLKRERMEASARMTLQALELPKGGKALVCLDTRYVGGKMMLVRALLNDMEIIVTEPTANPLAAIGYPTTIDFTAIVPLQLETMLDDPQAIASLNAMKAIIVGGAPVSHKLHQALQIITAPLYATYGMTETISHIALKRLNGTTPDVYFKALPGVVLATDTRGCLTINAPVTGNKTIHTTDRVNLMSENTFEWLGRMDNVINSGGVKVQSEKVETIVARWFEQKRLNHLFFVSGIADERLGEKVCLFVEAEERLTNEAQLLNYLGEHLSAYEVPKQVYYIEKFVMTDTGKVVRGETKKIVDR